MSFGETTIGWLRQWTQSKQKHHNEVRQYLGKMREKLADNEELLTVIGILKAEYIATNSNSPPPKRPPKMSATDMRNLPKFLEPIGIKLRHGPKVPNWAYKEFSEEVLLCHRSKLLWEDDDYQTSCTYWPEFKKFALETERRLGT